MSETVRLAKRVAEMLDCSRGQAIQYIEGNWVTVNGAIVEEPGFRVAPQDRIELLPQASLAPIEAVTILLHKPSDIAVDMAPGLIVPGNRADDDHSGIRYLKRHLSGLTMIDLQETAASGLLVFTQDWRVVRKLVDDAARNEHEYIVEIVGDVALDGLLLLNQVQTFNGKAVPQVKVSWQNETRLRFAIKAAPNGLIKHLCEKVGLTMLSMKCIRMGRISMAGLAAGHWRYLTKYERF